MRLSVPYLEGCTPAYPPGGPANADRPRRTPRAHLQLTFNQPSRGALNATNSKYSKPSFFPPLFYQSRINHTQQSNLHQTDRSNTRVPRTAPTCGVDGSPLVLSLPDGTVPNVTRPQPRHEQPRDNRGQPTPTRTLNSPSPLKHQGSKDLQKQARWRHQDDTKAPPNAHPTRLGTPTVGSTIPDHPRTHRGHPHTPAPAAPQSTATAHPGHDTPHRQANAGSRQITTKTE